MPTFKKNKLNMAIVFWCYKDVDVCISRIKQLQQQNPTTKIYALYGGPHNEANIFKNALNTYIDDFYIHSSEDSHWKWINGDLVLTDWFKDRGSKLQWDSVAIIQWDMLLFDSVDALFPKIKKNEIFLSGERKMDAAFSENWLWSSSQKPHHKKFLAFKKHVAEYYQHTKPLRACVFALQIIPRTFFETYMHVKNITTGMLEYKVPTYAKILRFTHYKKDIGATFFFSREKPVSGFKATVKNEYIQQELSKKDGWRIFHPYHDVWESK
jgi:hypothetical protein